MLRLPVSDSTDATKNTKGLESEYQSAANPVIVSLVQSKRFVGRVVGLLSFDLMTMLRVIALVICLSMGVEANPRVFVVRTCTYLSSEHLSITISQTEAQLRGTFTFRFEPDRSDYIKELGASLGVEFPIWVPENDGSDPTIAEFWRAFGTFFLNGVDEKNRTHLDSVFAFSASLGWNRLPPQRVISYSGHLDSFVLKTYASQMQKPEFQAFKTEGAACVIVTLNCPPEKLRRDALTVSYRQPLLKTATDHRFVYLPSFYDLPKGISTADTNRYAIVLNAAADCTLRVTNGDERYEVAPKQKIVLSPRHLQPIRAVVMAGSNQAVQRSRGSHFAASESREPVPAGSNQ